MTVPNSSREYVCSCGSSRTYETTTSSSEVTNISTRRMVCYVSIMGSNRIITDGAKFTCSKGMNSSKTGGGEMIILAMAVPC